jgi:hypothetical protein
MLTKICHTSATLTALSRRFTLNDFVIQWLSCEQFHVCGVSKRLKVA